MGKYVGIIAAMPEEMEAIKSKKSKNNISKMWCWKSKCCKDYTNNDR